MVYSQAERSIGQWVVAFFPPTSIKNYPTTMLFKTMEAATLRFSKVGRTQFIYSSYGEFEARHSGKVLLNYIRQIEKALPFKDSWVSNNSDFKKQETLDIPFELSEKDREKLAIELWRICQAIGDKVVGMSQYGVKDKYTIKLDRLVSEEGREIWLKFPKQCRQIIEAFIKLQKTVLEETEINKLVTDLVNNNIIKTKQDPWRIFSYYAPTLGDSGFLYYPGKRHKLEDHEDNL